MSSRSSCERRWRASVSSFRSTASAALELVDDAGAVCPEDEGLFGLEVALGVNVGGTILVVGGNGKFELCPPAAEGDALRELRLRSGMAAHLRKWSRFLLLAGFPVICFLFAENQLGAFVVKLELRKLKMRWGLSWILFDSEAVRVAWHYL
jgi:hypothetical protein